MIIEILYNIIIFPIIQIIEISFTIAQKLFRETGVTIIFISVVVSALCLPLYIVAEKWQRIERDTVKKLKPKVDEIKKIFKGDEQYMILSAYYRQNHYHPIYALRSSFGVLIQIPFFIAAFYYLSNLELLHGVSFLFIKDLSSQDALISIGNAQFNILPFIMTLITCISGFIYLKELPVKDKFQVYAIAAVFLILLYNSPSALVLYWTMNNIFSLLKNIYFRIQYKYKHLILTGLFTIICALISIYSVMKFGYILKARLLSIVLLIFAFSPWIYFILKHLIIKINNIIQFKESTLIFILSVSLIWVLMGLFIPSQLISSSPQEFSFIDNYTNPLFFIYNTSMQILGLFVFLPICLYFLFSDKIKKILTVLFFIISYCFILNTLVFSGNYGLISVNLIYDITPRHSLNENLINILLLILSSFLLILGLLKLQKYIPILISLCVISLFSISLYNIININKSFINLSKYYIKKDIILNEINPIFNISKNNKNVVILMLDRAINGFFPYILDESPELKNIYSGFNFYPNTVSFNGYTAIGAPPVFGGYEYTPEEINKRDTIPLVEKHNQALLTLPRIFSDNNFNVIVTDPPYANYNQKPDLSIYNEYPDIKPIITKAVYTDFWLYENNIFLQKTSDVIKRNIFWYNILKCFPLFLRHGIYYEGTWCSPIPNHKLRINIDNYSVLDYLPRLTNIVYDDKNNLLLMTNNTTHENSFFQAPDYIPSILVNNYGTSPFSKESAYHVNAAAIKRVADWILFLKKNNVYDNTRIIIVSDHGTQPNFFSDIGLPFNVYQFNPLLLIKDFNSTGEITTDYTFMSNADVPYLSLIDLIENPVNPFTNNKISNERKNEPLYIAVSGSIHISVNSYQYNLNTNSDYYVHSNIFVKDNWKRVNEN